MRQAMRRTAVGLLASLVLLCVAACTDSNAGPDRDRRGASTTAARPAAPPSPPLVAAARSQIGITVTYDPAYVVLSYPGGDVPQDRGVCTDVVIRALRSQGLDLQRAVHEDMRADFAAYPDNWGLRAPDRNIDHRRVPNLQTFFARKGWSLAVTQETADYRAGDLVTWRLPGNLPHIGIVSDRTSWTGTPLILHNIGHGAREDDILFDYPITGHYRPVLSTPVLSTPVLSTPVLSTPVLPTSELPTPAR
jgi:hypothetical protein